MKKNEKQEVFHLSEATKLEVGKALSGLAAHRGKHISRKQLYNFLVRRFLFDATLQRDLIDHLDKTEDEGDSENA